ncbi:neural cell adhesion molecule 2-like [Acropora millepora]|uniref:neural cell adhesion molecule 2-like n=1 Tax=Acropora millepora TaxID=45264 RepID=UPI001CF41A10|nr:neural cell adhesion molecule 2-like [Acropora millepora]
MGCPQRGSFLRWCFVVGIAYVHQVAVIDAGIDMLTFGITTVDKTFRIDCKVIDEEFRGWFDLKGEEVTARRVPGQLIRAKKYVEERGNVYTLVIRKVQFVDGGNYTCRGDKTEKIFSLFVEFEVIQFPEDQNLFVGRTQTIQCPADGYPKPTFAWLKDFFWIDLTNPRFNLLPNGSLLISPVHEKDRGEYACRITQLMHHQGTSLRQQEQYIIVTVKGPPRLNVEKSTNQTQQYSYVGSPIPVTISCVWWGYPKPKLSIQKDNTDLPIQNVSLKTDDFLSYLTISVVTVTDDDLGAYTCNASNSFGSASHVVVINKQGLPRLNVEKSTNQTQLYSFVGSPIPVIISCVWWGYPKPKLTIQKDNTDLPSQYVSLKTDDFLSYLTVSVLTVTDDDFGAYTCNASNSFGSASHVVVINKQATNPEVPQNVVVETTCKDITLTWQKPIDDGGMPITNYVISLLSSSDQTLLRMNVDASLRETNISNSRIEAETAYKVAVLARNDVGYGDNKTVSAQTKKYCVPGKPRITNTEKEIESSFTLKWLPPSYDGGDNIMYQVEWGKKPITDKTDRSVIDKTPDTSREIENLENEVEYEFRVMAKNQAGAGEPDIRFFTVKGSTGMYTIETKYVNFAYIEA